MTTDGQAADSQLAVLIDFENVGLNSIQWLFDQLSHVGRVIVKRAYGDWSAAGSKRDQLLELGIEPIQLFHAAKSKNSSDIRLAIDAVDLLYQSPVDTFVIVSSDSDFVSLVNRLRAAGKSVIGAGREETAPHSLVISCDRYYYLEKTGSRPKGARMGRRKKRDNLLPRAIEASIDEDGRALGSKLHQAILRIDPGFDFRALGYPTFAKYLEASPGVKVIRPRGEGDVTVELIDQLPSVAVDPSDTESWDVRVDAVWSKRAGVSGHSIPGPNAAADAAKFLGVRKLSASRYRTLQILLDASELLRSRWSRDGNSIIRR
jgi:uncharacterized protein (TIGR00288 family)